MIDNTQRNNKEHNQSYHKLVEFYNDDFDPFVSFCCSFVSSNQESQHLFFGDWSRLNASNLIHILECFELASGLKVNIAKSRLLGVGVPNIEVELMASSLGCTLDSLPFTYLGLPVGKKMRACDGWNPIISRFRDMLSSWKAKSLSIGGRLTLVKSVLGSLPIYYLSLFKAPQKIIHILEAIRCDSFGALRFSTWY
ncbi:hypothetical protein Tco_0387015 [Tanacetum coccineum]